MDRITSLSQIAHSAATLLHQAGSEVYRGKYGDTNVIVKYYSALGSNEAEILREIQGKVLAPRCLFSHRGEIVSPSEKTFDAAMVLECVEGTILRSYMDRLGEWSKDHSKTKAVLGGLLETLATLHDLGFVHADLHGDNIVVTDDLRVYLIDFGQAFSAREPHRFPFIFARLAVYDPRFVTTYTDTVGVDNVILGVLQKVGFPSEKQYMEGVDWDTVTPRELSARVQQLE